MGMLSYSLRILLFLGSLAVFTVISYCIRKRRIQLKDGVFWIVFSFMLVLISIFPVLAVWAAKLIGIQSPANCVFLIMIFLLGCHQFVLTLRISQLEMKNSQLIQSVAIQKALSEEAKQSDEENLLLFR